MKKIILITTGFIFSLTSYAQNTDSINVEEEIQYEITENEDDELEIVTEEVVVESKADTTNFELGDKEIQIIEKEDETSLTVKDKKSKDGGDNENSKEKWGFDDDDDDKDFKNKSNKFKGHWAGFEFGLNNYVDKDFSISRTAENEFMDINTGKSWNFNLNFTQYSLPVISDRFGLITGMGIEWSNYHFANNNTIYKNTTTKRIEEEPIVGNLKKNRLQTTYLTVPVLLELQLLKGSRKNRLHLTGGVIGGLKIFSNAKYKVSESGGPDTNKDKSDFYLNPFRYGVTARAGYKSVDLYFNYYMTPLFIDGRGPELHPIAMGLALSF